MNYLFYVFIYFLISKKDNKINICKAFNNNKKFVNSKF